MKIKIEGMTLEQIDYRKLKPLQGNLKLMTEANYRRLKKSLSEKNLFVPLVVWNNGTEYQILDGHGRERLFQKEDVTFIDSAGKETREVPCLIVHAKSLQDAKEKLLVISSQYQTITQEGFDEFNFDIDPNWLSEAIHFDALPVYPIEKEEKESNVLSADQFIITIECRDEAEQRDLYEELESRGFNCKSKF